MASPGEPRLAVLVAPRSWTTGPGAMMAHLAGP